MNTQTKSSLSYFYGSLASFIPAFAIGYMIAGWKGVWIVAILSVLEISLSLDNAVINAQVLNGWNSFWRNLFLWIGLPIAVFGMRLVFPIVIVSITTGLGAFEVLNIATYHPDEYARALTAVHHEVAAFGGAFLLMVFLHFFVDVNKNKHWLHWIEAPLTKLGKIEAVEAAIALIVIYATGSVFNGHERSEFIIAGMFGVITFILAKGAGSLLGGEGDGGTTVIKQGIGGLLYLEILDASFSFDGVIGAFALSNNLFVIAAGLGVGAMFVRSITIFLVEKGTLSQFRFLEHGAFWAIGALAVIMFVGVTVHIPETITGLLGAILIGLSLWSSVHANKREQHKINAHTNK